MEVGNLLTLSGLTHPQVSSATISGSFCFFGVQILNPNHARPGDKCINLTTGHILLWARNAFGGKLNHWQVSQEEVGQIHSNIYVNFRYQGGMAKLHLNKTILY
jgi:hypothetical protein